MVIGIETRDLCEAADSQLRIVECQQLKCRALFGGGDCAVRVGDIVGGGDAAYREQCRIVRRDVVDGLAAACEGVAFARAGRGVSCLTVNQFAEACILAYRCRNIVRQCKFMILL